MNHILHDSQLECYLKLNYFNSREEQQLHDLLFYFFKLIIGMISGITVINYSHQILFQTHTLVVHIYTNIFQTIWFPLYWTLNETSHYLLPCCFGHTEKKGNIFNLYLCVIIILWLHLFSWISNLVGRGKKTFQHGLKYEVI